MVRPIGFVVLAACAASFRLCAEDMIVTNTWQGASGGSWSAPANWSQGHAPKSWEYVLVPDSGTDLSIAIDDDNCTCGCFALAPRLSGANVTTTLTGLGKLVVVGAVGTEAEQTCKSLACSLPSARRLFTINGPDVRFKGSNTLFVYGAVKVLGGAFTVDATVRLWWGGVSLLVDGASATFATLTYRSAGESVRVRNGGTLKVNGTIEPDSAAVPLVWEVSGGSTLDVSNNSWKLLDGCSVSLSDASVIKVKARSRSRTAHLR